MLEIARTLLTMPDLFNYWLTGQIQSEFSIATTTQCYDPRRQAWSSRCCKRWAYRARSFRGSSWNESGKLCPPLNEAPGLAEAVVIAPACHDTGSPLQRSLPRAKTFRGSVRHLSIMGAEMREPVINVASYRPISRTRGA